MEPIEAVRILKEEVQAWREKIKALRPSRLRRILTPEEWKERQAARLEACRASRKLYYQANRDKMIAYQQKYYSENKDKKREYYLRYYRENKERILAKAHADAAVRTEKLLKARIEKLRQQYEEELKKRTELLNGGSTTQQPV